METFAPLFPFTVGQAVQYVCYDKDPSYTAVERPQFGVYQATIGFVNLARGIFRFKGESVINEIHHFADRMVAKEDQEGLDRVVKAMAASEVTKFRHQAQPGVWTPGAVPQSKLDLYAAVATQYENGDYEIVNH